MFSNYRQPDIVERLRAVDNTGDYLIGSIGAEAANEIERLRGLCDSLGRDNEGFIHEIERLRTALTQIRRD